MRILWIGKVARAVETPPCIFDAEKLTLGKQPLDAINFARGELRIQDDDLFALLAEDPQDAGGWQRSASLYVLKVSLASCRSLIQLSWYAAQATTKHASVNRTNAVRRLNRYQRRDCVAFIDVTAAYGRYTAYRRMYCSCSRFSCATSLPSASALANTILASENKAPDPFDFLWAGNVFVQRDSPVSPFAEHPKRSRRIHRGRWRNFARRKEHRRGGYLPDGFVPLPDPVESMPDPGCREARESEHDQRGAEAEAEPAAVEEWRSWRKTVIWRWHRLHVARRGLRERLVTDMHPRFRKQ